MTFNSEPSEASRKTLDEIRREIDAEFALSDDVHAGAEPRDDVADRPSRPARPEPPTRVVWSEPESDETSDAPAGDFRMIADRHERVLGRRHTVVGEDRPSRSGYLLAGLVGCIAGQVLLLAFLMVARYADWPPVPRTAKSVRPPSEAAAPAPPSRPSPDEAPRASAQSRPEADAPAASLPSPTASAPAAPPEDKPAGSEAPAPAAAAATEPRVASSPPSATVSAARIAAETASRPADGLPPRVVREPRSPAGQSPALSATARAEAQARLRATLNQWLGASGRSTPSGPASEPVIVLGPDGRTAKTYVSISSPIGLIPREQRWELGPRGWSLVEDRQAGLPVRPAAPASRDR